MPHTGPQLTNGRKWIALACFMLTSACDVASTAQAERALAPGGDTRFDVPVDIPETPGDSDATPTDTEGLAPPDERPFDPPALPEAGPVFAGIPNCASMFLDEEGVCRPRYGTCAGNELALPHTGCTPFVKVPAEAPLEQTVIDVVEDSVAALGGGVGLAEALATAPAGALLRLGPGWFAGEHVIDRDIHIEGTSALVTHIDNLPAGGGVLFTVNAGHLTITDAFLDSGGDTIVANGTSHVTLDRVHLMGHGNHGLVCLSDARCVVRRALLTPQQYSVKLAETAEVELDRVTFWTPANARAIECGNALGRLTVVDSMLADALSPKSAFSDVCALNQLVVRRSILSGLWHVTSTLWDISDSILPGVLGSLPTARMEFWRSRVGAVTVTHDLVASDVVFEGDNPHTANGELPADPRFLEFHGNTKLERVEVRGGLGDAVYVGGSLAAKQLRIVGTRAAGNDPGIGLRVGDGATATLEDSIIEQVQGNGISVSGFGSVRFVRSAIADLTAPPSGDLAYGAIASFGADVTFEGSRIERVVGIGVWAIASSIIVDGLWIDEIASGIGTDKNNGLIEGLSDGVLLATTATLDATDLFVRGAQRVAVLSDNGSGTITGGTLDRCRYGLVSTGTLDAWTLDELDNGCDEPVWSKTTLAVPRPGIQ